MEKVDDAAAFDGGYIEVGTGEIFGLSEFTVSAWARTEDEDASRLRTILARQDPTGRSYEKRTFVLWFDDDSRFFGVGVILRGRPKPTVTFGQSQRVARILTASGIILASPPWQTESSPSTLMEASRRQSR